MLYGTSYWNEIINFEALVRHGTILRDDVKLFSFVDSPQEALDLLKAKLPLDPEPTTPAFAKSRTSFKSEGDSH